MDDRQMKLGGTYHWSSGYKLFMDYDGGRMDLESPFKQTSKNGEADETYSDGSLTFEITKKKFSGGLSVFLGSVRNSAGQGSEQLKCYLRSSGLE